MIRIALNTVLLFIMSALMPISSFILPVYKIKNMPKLSSKDRLLANLISGGLIYLIDSQLFYIYITFFLFIEGLYYIFDRTEIEIFDRILISTIISSVIGYILMRTLIGDSTEFVKLLETTYKEYLSLDPTILSTIMEYIKTNLLFILFTYVLVINYFTYFIIKGKKYRKWGISYLWVLVYIVTFFVDKTLKIDNFYIKNLYSISTLIYTIYGIKVLYSIFRVRIKWKIYGKLLAVATAIFFPVSIFVLGVIDSFGIIKIKIRRKE